MNRHIHITSCPPVPPRAGRWSRAVVLSVVVGLVGVCASVSDAAATKGQGKQGTATKVMIDCGAARKPINPMIYGIGFNAIGEQRDTQQWSIGATARRWGGNPTSRYNWEANAWNTALDYFWRNVSVLDGATPAWKQFLDANRDHQVLSALSVPTIGWVAKDTSSYSFPVKSFGPQQQNDPDITDAGNGRNPGGKELTPSPPDQTSVRSTSESVGRWLSTAARADTPTSRAVDLVYLDNEPDLWNETHRDVHPEPAGYDELLQRSIEYGSAVRAATPAVKIAGPSSWGWWGYFYSAKDAKAGFSAKPDRRAHGDTPFLQWYLRQLRSYEQRTGIRVLDDLDVHFYPQGANLYGGGGATDPKTAALRIRSTRALWDSTYTDESWIGEPVRLLPRLQELINQEYPGLGISIGEYNFGGDEHISGAIAQAEALGRFGQAGVAAAYLWTYPALRSAQYWGFRAFRNFDGRGGHFLDQSVRAQSDRDVSAFASTDAATSQVVAVLINQSASTVASTSVSLASCGPVTRAQQWSYTGGENGFTTGPAVAVVKGSITSTLAPWSVNVVRFERGTK